MDRMKLIGGLVVVLALAGALHGQESAPPNVFPAWLDPATLNPNVPGPGDVIGHPAGADAVRYDALERYLHALAEASEFVTLNEYGRTHEGRTLYYLTITSTENHARLEQIKRENARLADPRELGNGAEGRRLADTLPGVAWLAYSIHGDEVSPCDSAMVIAYVLAAGTDETTKRLRDELVVHIDPLQNPDGRERYLSQIQTLRGKVMNPDVQAMHHSGLWSAGRGNHYLFDMNRDWLMQSQPETIGRAKAILEWNPHLLVDAHEMGATDTYLFDPPREPINIANAPAVMRWRDQMSIDQAAAFNHYGWSYYTGEWYDEWYPGYTNAWATLIGAIGLLYEQAGYSGSSVKLESGEVMTYEQAVHHNVVASFANLETLRANRRAILRDYLADRQWAVSGEAPFHDSFVILPHPDRARVQRFRTLLERHGIEYEIAAAECVAHGVTDTWGEGSNNRTFPAGSIIVRPNQPQRRLLHAVLGFDPHMSDQLLLDERTELEQGRGSMMYDITAWNLPMAFDLEAVMCDRVEAVETGEPAPVETAIVDRADYGYLAAFESSDVYPFLARLLEAGVNVRIANKPFTHQGVEYAAGAILIRRHENDDTLIATMRAASEGLEIDVRAANTALNDEGLDLGGREFPLLHAPRIAIASQWPTSTGSFGAAWFLLDARVGLRASPINIQNLGRMDLRKYNVLILPSAGGLTRALDAGGVANLRTWVESGGTLIALAGSASALAGSDGGLTSVKLRSSVLEELDEYVAAVEEELAARDVNVDVEAVWSRDAERAGDEEGTEEKDSTSPKVDERAERRARRFSPQGTIVSGLVDTSQWLAFGLDERLPLLISGSSVFMSRAPTRTPVRLGGTENLRLSGLFWPDARSRYAHSAYATVERRGNGQVILFAHDPFFRGYWEGTGRLLLNAAILGPGMGTSQPMPW